MAIGQGRALARRVDGQLMHIGWIAKRQSGFHRTLVREGWQDVVFAFHDGEETGTHMIARIAKHTGITAEDM